MKHNCMKAREDKKEVFLNLRFSARYIRDSKGEIGSGPREGHTHPRSWSETKVHCTASTSVLTTVRGDI